MISCKLRLRRGFRPLWAASACCRGLSFPRGGGGAGRSWLIQGFSGSAAGFSSFAEGCDGFSSFAEG